MENQILFDSIRGIRKRASDILVNRGKKSFDAILILFTSLGYSGIKEDIHVLKDLINVADSNCILIIETENRDWRIKNFQPHVEYKFRGLSVHENWKFNLETSISEGDSYYYRILNKGNTLRLALNLAVQMRLYSLHELVNIVATSGWEFLGSYDGFQYPNPATVDSPSIVTVRMLH